VEARTSSCITFRRLMTTALRIEPHGVPGVGNPAPVCYACGRRAVVARPVREPTIGDQIDGRYTLRREIARGGGGVVFEAEHLHTGRAVAIKVMHGDHARDSGKRDRMLFEARALTLARQLNVVEVLDAGVLDGTLPFIVMELLSGRALDGLLASRQRLEVGNVVHLGRQLAFALAHIHARGLIHRDIKPSNIMIALTETGQEVLKVFDFGIVLERIPSQTTGVQARRTEDNTVVGTPAYMAPEQLLGSDDVDYRCDVYAVGVTLYECLTGTVPFDGTFGEILLKVSTTEAPQISDRCPDVPPDLVAIIARCMARAPEDRFQSAGTLYDALTTVAVQRFPRASLLGTGSASHAPLGREDGGVAPPPDFEKRRRHARAPYQTPVRMVFGDGSTLDGRSEDISEAGLLVIVPTNLSDQNDVEVRFALPTSGRIVTTRAKARWIRAARMGAAVGIEMALTEEDRATIRYYVSVIRGE
jgi:serine/threonine protein kinase